MLSKILFNLESEMPSVHTKSKINRDKNVYKEIFPFEKRNQAFYILDLFIIFSSPPPPNLTAR